MLDHQLLTAFVVACILLVVSALGWFIKNWFASLSDTIKDLSLSVQALTSVVNGLEKEMALQKQREDQIRTELARQGDTLIDIGSHTRCDMDECPFRAFKVEQARVSSQEMIQEFRRRKTDPLGA